MKSVKVDKLVLLDALETSLEDHRRDFVLAYEAFHKKAVENAEARLNSIKAGRKVTQEVLWINMDIPTDHSEDYERTIEMLSWEIDDAVILTEVEFRQFVQNKWAWSDQFATSNIMYTGSASPSKTGL